MELNKGDIVTVNFNPQKYGEMGKVRPALIISRTTDNQYSDHVIVLPFSTKIVKDSKPFRLFISKKVSGLEQDSDLVINTIRTISKKRVGEKISSLNSKYVEEVKKLLCENI